MAPIQSAIVNYGSCKTCFLFVPPKWIEERSNYQGVHVFKVEYGNNQRAYFSGKKSTASSTGLTDIINLNGKYALTLGIKKDEQVLIHHMKDHYAPVDKVWLQPVQPDDWEMMQLNASTIEQQLLNQICIVWKDQVFPVWINQTNLFVKVVNLEPLVEPGMLMEFTTEMHINPNERSQSQSPLKKRKKKKENVFQQYQHLRRRKKTVKQIKENAEGGAIENTAHQGSESFDEQSLVKRPIFSFLEFLVKTSFIFDTPSNSPKGDDNGERNFHSLDFDFSLRVISFSRLGEVSVSLPLGIQSTTVFISESTFCKHFDMNTVPECFIANLSKSLSPLQKKEVSNSERYDTRSKDSSKKEKKELEGKNDAVSFNSVSVNVIVLKLEDKDFEVPSALFMSTDFICVPLELKRRLGLEISSRVRLRSVEVPPMTFDTILLHPIEVTHQHSKELQTIPIFHKWVEDAIKGGSSIILCDGTLVKLAMNKGAFVDFVITLTRSDIQEQNSPNLQVSSSSTSSSERSFTNSSNMPSYGYLNNQTLKKIQVKVRKYSAQMKKSIVGVSGTHIQRPETLYQTIYAPNLSDIGGVKDIAGKVIVDLEIWFKLRPALSMSASPCAFPCSGSMLVTGEKGVGKTTFVKSLCKKFINYPHFISVLHMQCLPLRGKRVENIAKKWASCLSECVHRQPSILVFDDLHQLASMPDQENGPDALYFSSIAQVFLGLLEKILVNDYRVTIMASSKSVHSLHPILTNVDGRQVFQSIIEIKPPDMAQRCEILQSLLKTKPHISSDCISTISWQDITAKTEGYIAQDLCILVDRALHSAWVRKRNQNLDKTSYNKVTLDDQDFEIALNGYTPAALRDLHLQKGNDKTWADVGGLADVKKALQQTLTWPIKYESIFSSCGLKPQQNILLYGPPGTGKTLLAGVVASMCELNFICIKGPELLSKFIGASEQAVRDLFVRAMSAKPCILFFDEFDALAPRRGHDSTGVTDRVVNQLLTQMDGVESLQGVCILAATSKPELIDPALLRPGRLDKCLYCPLPNQIERLEILKCLSCKLIMADDVDFESIAAQTEYYSGADLQALLYSAQIMAFHDIEDKKIRTSSFSTADCNSTEIVEDIIYLSSLETGATTPPIEEAKAILQETDLLTHKIATMNVGSEARKNKRSSCIPMVLEQRHLLEVLDTMKPSVSPEERLRYQRIFHKFQVTGGTDFAVLLKDASKRVTLA